MAGFMERNKVMVFGIFGLELGIITGFAVGMFI